MSDFLSPLVWFWMLIILAFISRGLRRKSISNILFPTAFVMLFLCSSTPLPQLLIYSLEKQYPVYNPAASEHVDYIVVLNGGRSRTEQLPPTGQMNVSSLYRITEGVRLKKLLPKAKLVLMAELLPGQKGSSAALTAVTMGVNAADTLCIGRSKDTWREAANFKARFPNPGKVILVTSAVHMPRAMAIFRSEGISPVAAPAEYQIKGDKPSNFLSFMPSYTKVRNMQKALHEYLGLLYHRSGQWH